jgi:hypothetical protein
MDDADPAPDKPLRMARPPGRPGTTSAEEPQSRFADLPSAEVEDRLSRWASSLAAAECEFLDLLAEFDAREAWGDSGMRSTAHWLSWRLGLRLGVAREKVRVARALQRLPLVHEAFSTGALSYCKVRALSRVATDVTEAELVGIARGATGAQLETIVRQWRRILIGETSASARLRRGVRRRVDDDESIVFTIRLSPEDGPVFDEALALARRAVLDEEGRVVETPEESALAEELTGDPASVRSDADAFLLIASSFLASGPSGEAGDRHLVLVHANIDALADACRRKAESVGARSAATPAATAAAGRAATAASRRTSDVSAETSCDSATIAADPPAELPGRHCIDVSAETSTDPGPPTDGATAPSPILAGAPAHQESYARRPAICTTDDGHPISASTVMRMLCQSPAQLLISARDGRPLDLGRTSRNADRRQRRVLRARDGKCCRFPGCTQRRWLIPHHAVWWSRQGRTDLDLLVSLCPTHHHAVHELRYDVRAIGGGRFAWYRPDGQEIPAAPATSCDSAGKPPGLMDAVDPHTIVPMWGGERIDFDHLLGGMAANLLIRDGHRLTDIPYAALDETLRQAARWPAATPGRGPFDAPEDATAA